MITLAKWRGQSLLSSTAAVTDSSSSGVVVGGGGGGCTSRLCWLDGGRNCCVCLHRDKHKHSRRKMADGHRWASMTAFTSRLPSRYLPVYDTFFPRLFKLYPCGPYEYRLYWMNRIVILHSQGEINSKLIQLNIMCHLKHYQTIIYFFH